MTNRMTERLDEALVITQEHKKIECRKVEEKATKERQVIKAFDDSLAEFGSLYAELAMKLTE